MKTKVSKSYFLKPLAVILLPATLLFYIYLGFLIYFDQKIYPGIKIASMTVSNLTPQTAKTTLRFNFTQKTDMPLQFNYQGQVLNLDIKKASPVLYFEDAVETAYGIGRAGNYLEDLIQQVQMLLTGTTLTPKLVYQNRLGLIKEISIIAKTIKKDPVDAKVTVSEIITITPSDYGQALDETLLENQIESYLKFELPPPAFLPIKKISPKFTTAQAEKSRQVLENLNAQPLKLKFEDREWIIDQTKALTLLYLGNNQLDMDDPLPLSISSDNTMVSKNIQPEEDLVISQKNITAFIASLAAQINQEGQDARFTFDPSTRRVKEFQEAKIGKKLDEAKTFTQLITALARGQGEILLSVKTTAPEITTDSTNDYGVKELIGQGISYFTGSITNRIYNIGLAASRINGVLIAPGATFSFNNIVGEISASSGYKQAYVIKDGRTVLDDGGGVCQVSTTVFRAVLNAGLPIVERVAHAYRVSYYEQGFPPGLDATVFAPSPDFRFKNDTPAYILIQARVEGNALYVDLYGTPDGRVTTVSKPVILSQTPPSPEVRQDDPTLPKGVVKQVDWAAWGATVTFTRTVIRGGETLINETFRSNYRPWQAVYLVGTKE